MRYARPPDPGKPRHLGAAGWEELTDGVIVAGQPHGAPSWFPCNDRPSNKATYRMSITVAAGYRVVANGRLAEQPPPLEHGHLGLRAGRADGDLPRHRAHRPLRAPHRRRRRARCTPSCRSGCSRRTTTPSVDQPRHDRDVLRLFGPYPFAAYTVVVTDDDLEIPLEAQGLSTFGANFLTSDWDSVRLVAHELSHQWFGNSLTLGSWQDIWLHEGFACYAEWIWSEESGRAVGPRRAPRSTTPGSTASTRTSCSPTRARS